MKKTVYIVIRDGFPVSENFYYDKNDPKLEEEASYWYKIGGKISIRKIQKYVD
jgi:hypothetical protein